MFSEIELAELSTCVDALPSCSIVTSRPDFVRVFVKATFIRYLHVSLFATEAYPGVALDVQFRSKYIPIGALNKLQSALRKHIETMKADGAHAVKVVQLINQIVCSNRLLQASDEVNRVRELLRQQPDNELKVLEKKGVLSIKFKRRGYLLAVRVTVPELYPKERAVLTLGHSNFHPLLLAMLKSGLSVLNYDLAKMGYRWRSAEIRRGEFIEATRLAAERALSKAEQAAKAEAEREWAPTTNDIVNLKHDVKVLAQLNVLKKQDQSSKRIRKLQKRIRKVEAVNQKAREDGFVPRNAQVIDVDMMKTNLFGGVGVANKNAAPNDDDNDDDEEIDLAGDRRDEDDDSEATDDNHAKLSILAHVSVVCEEFFRDLLDSDCALCENPLLPKEAPKDWHLRDLKKSERIERLTCGCFLHRQCIVELLSKPPFGQRKCPRCERKFSHQQFNIDYMQRMEDRFLQKQKRERELADVVDFLGV